VESKLSENVTEHINAEICRGTIKDVAGAVTWLKHTFFWFRMQVNPMHYNVKDNPEAFDRKLKELCTSSMQDLEEAGLLSYDEECFDVIPSEGAFLMAKFCISLETIKLFNSMRFCDSTADVLTALSSSKELSDVKLRRAEKRPLAELNKKVRYPVKSKTIKISEEKVFLLIQISLGELFEGNEEFGLRQECPRILSIAARIAKCFHEYILVNPEDLFFNALDAAVFISNSLENRVWADWSAVLKQLPGIGAAMSKLLSNAGIRDFNALEETHPRMLEQILKKNPPFGNEILSKVSVIPKLSMDIKTQKKGSAWEVSVSCVVRKRQGCTTDNVTGWFILYAGRRGGRINFYNRFKARLGSTTVHKIFVLEEPGELEKQPLRVIFISDDYAGVQESRDCLAKAIVGDQKMAPSASQTAPAAAPTAKKKKPLAGGCAHTCLNKRTCRHKCCNESFENLYLPAATGSSKRTTTQDNLMEMRSKNLGFATRVDSLLPPRAIDSRNDFPKTDFDLNVGAPSAMDASNFETSFLPLLPRANRAESPPLPPKINLTDSPPLPPRVNLAAQSPPLPSRIDLTNTSPHSEAHPIPDEFCLAREPAAHSNTLDHDEHQKEHASYDEMFASLFQ